MADHDFDLFVIGAGSGGVRAARLAANLGKKVAIAEESRIGGTCVIRGCVPKKLFVYASQFPEHFEDAQGYGWRVEGTEFNWPSLVAAKNREIGRLEGVYRSGLVEAGVTIFESRAELASASEVRLAGSDKIHSAETILIATGGHANPHASLPGHEYCIYSDQAFDLKALPNSIIIAGAGYIAVEFANIFHGLGVDTTIIYRGEHILSGFDFDLRCHLQDTMASKGIKFILKEVFEKIERRDDGRLRSSTSSGREVETDMIMLAVGRSPNTFGLGLEKAGVRLDKTGAIIVDEYSRSSVDSIYAIGDVTNRVQLTPVAIHEAICFVETAFKCNPTKPDHDCIATAVFSQPEIGTVGQTEDRIKERHGSAEIYCALFRPMRHTLSGRDEKMLIKLVVDPDSRKVLGAHLMGPDAGEMAQLLAIPIKAGLTKDQFDQTMAVHPTAAEEIVTMYSPSYRIVDGKKLEA